LKSKSFTQALAVWEKKGIRPTYRPGFMGKTGPEIDKIDECGAYLMELQRRIVEERNFALTGKDGTFTGSYLVFFKTQAAAAMAAGHDTLRAQRAFNFTIAQAPGPEEVRGLAAGWLLVDVGFLLFNNGTLSYWGPTGALMVAGPA
jgi:hypothetical protein